MKQSSTKLKMNDSSMKPEKKTSYLDKLILAQLEVAKQRNLTQSIKKND